MFSTKLSLWEEPSLEDFFKTTNAQEFHTGLILQFSEHLVSYVTLILKTHSFSFVKGHCLAYIDPKLTILKVVNISDVMLVVINYVCTT